MTAVILMGIVAIAILVEVNMFIYHMNKANRTIKDLKEGGNK